MLRTLKTLKGRYSALDILVVEPREESPAWSFPILAFVALSAVVMVFFAFPVRSSSVERREFEC